MTNKPLPLWILITLLLQLLLIAAEAKGLNQAVAQYHQARYATSLSQLETLRLEATGNRRDSLTLFQYLGMASAKVGHDSAAIEYFSVLLQLDSLFQFPKNEDETVLTGFTKAREKFTNRAAPPEPAQPSIDSEAVVPKTFTPPSFITVDPHPIPVKSSKIGIAYGVIPMGIGWMARGRPKTGLGLGLLQAGGMLLSIYASEIQSREQGDLAGIQDPRELSAVKRWQWVQGISLSTALGAYLFSVIAALGD